MVNMQPLGMSPIRMNKDMDNSFTTVMIAKDVFPWKQNNLEIENS